MDRSRRPYNRERNYSDRDRFARRDNRDERNHYRNDRDVEAELRYRSDFNDGRNDVREDDYRRRGRYNEDERYSDNRNYRNEGESYASTLRNYHPRGGRRIEASKPEDLEWQSNASYRRNRERGEMDRRDRDYEQEARNYNRQDDYRWSDHPDNYSRFHRDDRGYRGDYDTDFYWQT